MSKYQKITFDGSTFPDDPYRKVKVSLNSDIRNIYIPELQKVFPNGPLGLHLFLIAMTDIEGFWSDDPKRGRKASKSFRTNNPGNIGNMDDGSTNKNHTLADGIRLQESHLRRIISGKNKYYPLNKPKYIPPTALREVINNPKLFPGFDTWSPGYRFVYTGQLDQFIKIYSTGACQSNTHINNIVSLFKDNGITITPESKIQDIIEMTASQSEKSAGVKAVNTDNGNGANLRTGPGITFPKIIGLADGSEVVMLKEENGWSNVKAGDREGWVKSEYLK